MDPSATPSEAWSLGLTKWVTSTTATNITTYTSANRFSDMPPRRRSTYEPEAFFFDFSCACTQPS
ncbi:MAG: hypothetical protein IAE78_28435 [Myxococcus sp.]|nr:hypothetical protein [Myxococcus sp.]